jgi:hypothetical protein
VYGLAQRAPDASTLDAHMPPHSNGSRFAAHTVRSTAGESTAPSLNPMLPCLLKGLQPECSTGQSTPPWIHPPQTASPPLHRTSREETKTSTNSAATCGKNPQSA